MTFNRELNQLPTFAGKHSSFAVKVTPKLYISDNKANAVNHHQQWLFTILKCKTHLAEKVDWNRVFKKTKVILTWTSQLSQLRSWTFCFNPHTQQRRYVYKEQNSYRSMHINRNVTAFGNHTLEIESEGKILFRK